MFGKRGEEGLVCFAQLVAIVPGFYNLNKVQTSSFR
jgi:hypothetical protein